MAWTAKLEARAASMRETAQSKPGSSADRYHAFYIGFMQGRWNSEEPNCYFVNQNLRRVWRRGFKLGAKAIADLPKP